MKRKPLSSNPVRSGVRHALHRQHAFKPSRLVALLAGALLAPSMAFAQSTLPSGMSVVAGQASASQSGKQLTITNSANTILNWQSFSIGAGNSVQFIQPSSSSQVLNRVTGNDPSSLLGSLSSNGRVWLLNPNGVLFGQGAQVNVAGLVVSTLNLSNENWLAGQYQFSAASTSTPAAAIDNQGTLRGSLGGRIVLVGGSVSNEGVIDAPGGQVLLAAGQSVDLVDTGAPNLSVHVSAAGGNVLNLGTLSADGGHIDVYGAAVNQQGIVRADSLGTGPGGSIVLNASGQLTLAEGSHTSADSTAGTAGAVQLTGNLVALEDGSAVSASGATGGGVVLVGGGAQGQDASVQNAQALYFASGASINADSLSSGNGGHIVLWSDTSTRAYGSLSARGGATGGNGGLIETSGGWLDANPLSLSVSAPHGLSGQWLLDPYNVTISDAGSDTGYSGFNPFTPTTDATVSSATLISALNSGTNVTIQTGGSSGSSAGNILLTSANILVTAAAPGSLTLIADHDIELLNSTVQSTGGAMPVSLYSGRAGLGSILLSSGSISTNGGAIFLGGYATYTDAQGTVHTDAAQADPSDPAFAASGVNVDQSSSLNAGSGNITIAGISGIASSTGVTLGGTSSTTTIIGHDISVQGSDSGSGNGVLIQGTIQAAHSINIQGVSVNDNGVLLYESTLSVAPAAVDSTASLSITGVSSASLGTYLQYSGATVSNGATLNLTGSTTGASSATGLNLTGDGNPAVTLDASNNGGAITLTAGGAGTTSSDITLNSITIQPSAAAGGGLTLIADHDITMSTTSIQSTGGATPVSLYSARSGLGSIFFEDISISTAGGAIFLGGYGTYVDASGVSHNDAAVNDPADSSNIGYGISIEGGSTLNAGSGNVSIYGSSSTTASSGVYLVTGTTISGHDIAIGGSVTASDSGTTGSYLTATLQATHSIDVEGNSSAGQGVYLNGSTLSVGPSNTDTSAFLDINGLSGSGARGANIYGSSLTVSNGAALNITGTGGQGAYAGLLVTAASASAPTTIDSSNGGGAITFSAPGSSLGIEIDTTTVSASSAGVVVNAGNQNLTLSQTQITSAGAVALTGGTVDLEASSGVTSTASGDAIIARSASGGISSLDTDNVPNPFSTPNGRWIIWLTDLSALPASLPAYDFQRFNVSSPSGWSADVGNGLVYSATETVTVSGTVTSRAYDGTLTAQVSGLTAVPADNDSLQATVNATAYAQFDTKDAGGSKTVTLYDTQSSVPVTVTDYQNKPAYGVTVVSQLTGVIEPATLTGSYTINKVYDGSSLYSVSVTGLTGLVGSETVQVTASGAFSDKDVGQNLPVSVEYQITSGSNGGLASNYSFLGPQSSQGTITPLALTLSGLVAVNRVYDATTVATATGTATIAPLGGDSVSLAGTPQLTFADKNVGQSKAVSVSGLTLTGADADDYTLVTSGLLTANITPATIGLNSLSALNKVYDTTTVASLSAAASVTPLGSDQLSVVQGQASFSDKNVGQGKTVTLSGYSLSGADAGNYILMSPESLDANITPATISLNSLSALNKVYDATTAASLSAAASVTPLGNDQLSVVQGQASFSDKNVGQGKTVTLSGYSLSGTDAGNYTLTTPAALSASITPATLLYVASPTTVHDGDALPPLQGNVTGFVGGDTQASDTSGSAVFGSPALSGSAGAGIVAASVGIYNIDGSGLSASNYVFAQSAGNAQALTVLGPRQVDAPATENNVVATRSALAAQQPTPAPGAGGVIDLTSLNPLADAGPVFGDLPVAQMSPGALTSLLSARDQFKQNLFSNALGALATQPGLADLSPCQSMKDAAAGTCLVTEQFKHAMRASGQVTAESAPSTAPATAPLPAQVAPAAAPAPANAVAVATPPKLATASVSPLFSYRQVRSATLPQIEHKVAVLIGVDDYQDGSIPHLTHAVGDAQAMTDLFAQRLGYETLTLASPTRGQVVATLNRLALEMGPHDSVLIYYAGHGAVVEGDGAGKGEGFWLLSDSQATNPKTWLSNADIARLLNGIGADQVALISDSCYSGTLAQGNKIHVLPGSHDAGSILAHRTQVVMSSGGNEPVFDAGKHGHSPFAWNLMNTLSQVSAWTPGGQVFERVRYEVARELPQHPQYAATGSQQVDADYLFEQRQLDNAH